ncbi:MAG: glycosyltransferase family 4 protein [Actinomycetota bacterium]|nr:glycosyltransferase family 4 protein [Actinomycetota bacterium]
MTPPKVAHVTTTDMSLRYLLLNQLRSLEQSGYDVVGISSAGPDVPALEAAGIRHIPVEMTRSALTPFRDLIAITQLYRLFRRERFAIVHAHNPKPGLLAQVAARLARVPVIVNTVHGFYFHDAMRPMLRRFHIGLEKVAARCSDVILSQNLEDIEVAVREGIAGRAKMKHLGNGIDLSQFDPASIPPPERASLKRDLHWPESALVVGYVGRLAARRKGFLDFLAAAREVAAVFSDVYFLVVGAEDKGKPDSVSPDVVDASGISNRFHFTGWLPNSELPRLYAAMDLLVLPSLFEGIPRTLMEAAAMGLPVVATDVKGNREVVENEVTGLLVPYADPASLAAAISRLVSDPPLRRRFGENALASAASRFDERVVFDMIRREYDRLLSEKNLNIASLDVPREGS